MKKKFLITLLFALSISLSAQESTTFILVRHAEKANDGTKNPPLSDEGIARSQNLAKMLANQEIAAVYSTPFTRTRETLRPLANMKDLEVQEYDPYAKGDWLATLVKKHPGETIVISGHSNTIPGLANALLGKKTFAQFDETDYSNFIIVVSREVGKGQLISLKF